MKNLKKLGIWLAAISTIACGYFAFVCYKNLNVGEMLAWLTASSWAACSYILELRLREDK